MHPQRTTREDYLLACNGQRPQEKNNARNLKRDWRINHSKLKKLLSRLSIGNKVIQAANEYVFSNFSSDSYLEPISLEGPAMAHFESTCVCICAYACSYRYKNIGCIDQIWIQMIAALCKMDSSFN